MARRNDENGRVVGFKDGQPVYKKTNRGERTGERQDRPRRNGGGRGYERRDGQREGAGERGERRPYNRKEQYGEPVREERFGNREGRYEPRDGYREGPARGERSRSYTERPQYYGDRDERGFERNERRGHERGERPGFGSEKFDRKSEELHRFGPRREQKRYDNMKPLPRDIPEEQAEVELPNIIMGRNPVKEAIKSGRSIDRILVTSEHDGSLNEILDLAFEAKLVVRNVERAKLDEICMPFGHNGRTGNHQGIIAYVPEAQYCELSDILDYAKEKGEPPFVVLLDGIEDPHNLGSIIRSAECAGAHGIVIPKRRSASVTATVVKTSAGATEHMRIAKVVNLPVAIERLKEAGVWVAGADMGGEPMYSADLKGPFALVVGAEGAGISRLVKEKCDYIVSVPLKGQMESLNASVAAAVLMFEKVRQESAKS